MHLCAGKGRKERREEEVGESQCGHTEKQGALGKDTIIFRPRGMRYKQEINQESLINA